MVVSELRGEKIDIIPWNPEPARFVAKALSPARVREVLVDDETMEATVVVPDDQLSLAIGKEGLNARLAARLTGWKIDIVSETEFARARPRPRSAAAPTRSSPAAARRSSARQALPEHVGSRLALLRDPAHRELAAREEAGEELDPSEAVPVGGFEGRRKRPSRGRGRGRGHRVEAAAGAEEEEQPAS